MKIIGARIIKTGIAVTITMLILNKLRLEPAVFGAVSAVLNLQPTINASLKNAFDQVKIQGLGILIGILFGYILGGNPFTMGLITILIIYIYKRLKLQNGIVMGVVAAIFILSSSPDQFFNHALSRTIVIFTGLAVSTIINIVFLPPRYDKKLIEKLSDADETVVKYFCHAVEDFVNLDSCEIHDHTVAKNKVYTLLGESRLLAEYIRAENNLKDESEKVMDYIDGIAEKADRIYEIIPIRIERRKKYNNPPISDEFRAILDLLVTGCPTIERVNSDIITLIHGGTTCNQEKINEKFWTKLTETIEEWQHNLNSSYFVHGLIDISVVANEIRWVSREGKKIIKKFSK